MKRQRLLRLSVLAFAAILALPIAVRATVGNQQKFDVYDPLPNRMWVTLYVQTMLNPRTIVSAKWAAPGKVASFTSEIAGAYWIRVEIKKSGDTRANPETLCDTTAEVHPGDKHFLTAHLTGTSCWLSQT